MKQPLYIFTFFLLIFSGCTQNRSQIVQEEKGSSEILFEDYLKSLDPIPLPLSHNPLGQLPTLSKNYDKQGFEKYKHVWTSIPLGILYNDPETVTLMDCSIGDAGLVPFLTTYDRQGNKIDSLGPYQKSGEGPKYKCIEYLTINKDKTITVIDSFTTYTLTRDSLDRDESSGKTSVGLTKYKIDENGRFRKEK